MSTLELVLEDVKAKTDTPKTAHLRCGLCKPEQAACGTVSNNQGWSAVDKKNAVKCVVCLDLDDYYTQSHIYPCLREHMIRGEA